MNLGASIQTEVTWKILVDAPGGKNDRKQISCWERECHKLCITFFFDVNTVAVSLATSSAKAFLDILIF